MDWSQGTTPVCSEFQGWESEGGAAVQEGGLWAGYGGKRGDGRSIPGRGQSTHTVPYSTRVNYDTGYTAERMTGNVEDRWTLEGLCIMLESVNFILGGEKMHGP